MALLPGNCGVDKLFKRNAIPFSGLSLKQPASFLRLRPLPIACLPPPTSTRNNKLFVTGLSIYTTERTLQNAFSNHGKVVDVRIIMNKTTRRSKGFGFVEFATEEEASTALKEMNGKILNGWLITVDYAKPAPRSGRAPNMPQNTPNMNKETTAEAADDLTNP